MRCGLTCLTLLSAVSMAMAQPLVLLCLSASDSASPERLKQPLPTRSGWLCGGTTSPSAT